MHRLFAALAINLNFLLFSVHSYAHYAEGTGFVLKMASIDVSFGFKIFFILYSFLPPI